MAAPVCDAINRVSLLATVLLPALDSEISPGADVESSFQGQEGPSADSILPSRPSSISLVLTIAKISDRDDAGNRLYNLPVWRMFIFFNALFTAVFK